jgi:hypothetical protein
MPKAKRNDQTPPKRGAQSPELKNKEEKSSQRLNSGPTHSRDLVFQDLQVVLVPGIRLYCFPRARREACCAPRAPELVGSVVRLRSPLTREACIRLPPA